MDHIKFYSISIGLGSGFVIIILFFALYLYNRHSESRIINPICSICILAYFVLTFEMTKFVFHNLFQTTSKMRVDFVGIWVGMALCTLIYVIYYRAHRNRL